MLGIESGPFHVSRSSNTDNLRNPYRVRMNSTIALEPIRHAEEIKMLSVAVCLGNLPLQVKVAHIVQMPVNWGSKVFKKLLLCSFLQA